MLRFVDTPLGSAPVMPVRRSGRWDPALDPAILPGAEIAARRLTVPGALAVTTGQQPGLFTGPLYTFHKALSARALALALEAAWERPVVPIFWVAGDDHDYAEASVTHWIGMDGALVEGALPPRAADAPLRPMYQEILPPAVNDLLEGLERGLPASAARDATMAWLRRHYVPGASLAGAFGGALAQALGQLGVVCLDASHPAVKRAQAPWILEALRQGQALDRRLAERSSAMKAADRDPDVPVGEGASLVFLEGVGGRDRLLLQPDGVLSRRSNQRLSWTALESAVASDPERFSPNVLLRPVIESALLPTVAYIAGPAELQYLDLADCLYEPLEVTPQRPIARWSGVLVEPRVSRTLEKFGAGVEDLLRGGRELEARIIRATAPADFGPSFADLRAALEAGFARVAKVAAEIDPTLEKPAQSTLGGALNSITELEKRLLQAQKRRQGELTSQLERARTAILPDGRPQERMLGMAAFTGRYGFEVLDLLAEHLDAWFRTALEGARSTA